MNNRSRERKALENVVVGNIRASETDWSLPGFAVDTKLTRQVSSLSCLLGIRQRLFEELDQAAASVGIVLDYVSAVRLQRALTDGPCLPSPLTTPDRTRTVTQRIFG